MNAQQEYEVPIPTRREITQRNSIRGIYEQPLRARTLNHAKVMQAAANPGCWSRLINFNVLSESRIANDLGAANTSFTNDLLTLFHSGEIATGLLSAIGDHDVWDELSVPNKAWFARWGSYIAAAELNDGKFYIIDGQVKSEVPLFQRKLIQLGAKISAEDFGVEVDPNLVHALASSFLREDDRGILKFRVPYVNGAIPSR